MKHLKLFNSFLNEDLEESQDSKEIIEGVVSIKGGRILAHKVLNKLVDMDIIPVKKKSEEAIEAVASVLATTSMSESLNEAFEVIYTNQHVRGSKKFKDRSKALAFAKTLIAQGANEVDVFNAGSNFNSSADTDAVIAWYGNGTYMDNMSKKDPKLAAKKMDESVITEAINEAKDVKSEVIDRLSQFFGVSTGALIKFNFDGKDDVRALTKALNGTDYEGVDNIVRVAILSAKRDLGIDESYIKESSEVSEGMVQIAGKNKPSGAKVLATIIVDDLMKKDYLKTGADKVKSYLVDDIQDIIMNNTF